MDPFFEDLSVGYTVWSEGRLITKAEIIDFATVWDPQPFHVDEAAAADTFFGKLVASGSHTYAITMRLGVDCRVLTGNAVAGFGVDEMRFRAPVLPGSTLRARFRVSSMRTSASMPGLGIVRWEVETFDQDGSRVLSAIMTNLYRRRSSAVDDDNLSPGRAN
ncbi:MaoC family dehydratase N-terminal domain-containing protein [Sinorhizobium meliloti]